MRPRRQKLQKTDVDRFAADKASTEASVPFVLTAEAVASGAMPSLGDSGMPATLEQDVPPAFRFWKAADAEAARGARDALVDLGLFAPTTVQKVDGAVRRVILRAYFPKVSEGDAPLAKRIPLAAHALAPVRKVGSKHVVTGADELLDKPEQIAEAAASWLKGAESSDGALVVCAKDDAATRAAMVEHKLSMFSIATRPGVLFGTTGVVDEMFPHVEKVAPPVTKRIARLIKLDAAQTEEKFVLGIVLEPDVIDAQKDTYDAQTIKAAAWAYMEEHRAVGLQHQSNVTGKVNVVESYIAPVDMTVDGTTIKKGTWLMGLRFHDDGMWQLVKSGSLTGLSIGGDAVRELDPTATGLAPAGA